MSLYYLLLFFARFHNDPRVSEILFAAGPVSVTPAKIVGLLTVIAAFILTRPQDVRRRLKNSVALFWLIFLFFQALGTFALRLPMPEQSISSLISFSLMLVATLLLVTTEERLRKTVRAAILASAFAALWIYKMHFIDHIPRPEGVEQDANYEALTLLTAVPVALWMARYELSRLWRTIGLVCALLMSGGIVLCESRAGIIAAGAVGIAAVLLSRRKAATLALVAGLLAVGLAIAPHGLVDRFRSMRTQGMWNNGDELSTRIHFELVKAGLSMIESDPLLGVGLERFRVMAPEYNPNLWRITNHRFIAHNTYVQIAAESGLPALAAFLTMMLLAWFNLRAVRRRAGPALADLAFAMQLGLVGFAVAGAGVTAEYITVFWLIIFLSANLRQAADPTAVRSITRVRGLIATRPRRAVLGPAGARFQKWSPATGRLCPDSASTRVRIEDS